MDWDALAAGYGETGFAVVGRLLSDADVADLQAATDEIIAGSADVTAHTDVYDLEPDHSAAAPRVRRIKQPHLVHEVYERVRTYPAIIEVLQRLLGPDVRFESAKLNVKASGGGAAVDWHQDFAFLPYTNDDCLAVSVMVDDCGDDNGPLLCIPGSHTGPILDHHADGRFCGAINRQTSPFDPSAAVALTGPAGTVAVHHTRTIHGSAPNRSDRSRRLLLNQYVAADAWPLLHEPDLAVFDEQLVCGHGTITPRMEAIPVRLPLPPAAHQGSIYENQKAAAGGGQFGEPT